MKKAVQEFIAKAVPRKHNSFNELYVIDSEKEYDGFWGKNGYNNIILIGRAKGCEDYELITDFSDAIHCFKGGFNIEIQKETGIVALWSVKGFDLDCEPHSSVIFNDEV